MRVIPKSELFGDGLSSLAGLCAAKLYYDGNLTFSHLASAIMDFNHKNYFEVCEDDKRPNSIFIMPNRNAGILVKKRKGKNTFLVNSKNFKKYIYNKLSLPASHKKPIEFMIKKTPIKIRILFSN